jgi:uncharacterized membrane protein
MNTDAIHPLASAYLQELAAWARQLPPDDARELVEDIREHLASALRPDSPEADVRSALDRLGAPAEVVAAAGPPVFVARPAPPTSRAAEVSAIVCLVLAELLFILWPVAAMAWIAGIVLVAVSKTWSGRQKAWGLVALGSGFPLAIALLGLAAGVPVTSSTCSSTPTVVVDGQAGSQVSQASTCSTTAGHGVSWVVLAIAVAYLAVQAYTIWRLTRWRRTT